MKPQLVSATPIGGVPPARHAPPANPILRAGAGLLLALCMVSGSLAQTAASGSAASSSGFDDLAARATAARDAGRTEDAIRAYQAAVILKPDWDEGWWYLATLNYDSDQYSEAVPAFRKFVELNPRVGPAWALLGLAEFELAAYDDALAHLEKGQSTGFAENPEVARVAQYHLAVLWNRSGQFEKAAKLLTSQFGGGKAPDPIQFALGMSLLRIALLPTQVAPSRDALVHAAGDTAWLAARDGGFEDAARSFAQLLAAYPDTPYLHYAFAALLSRHGRYAEADEQLRQELALKPHDAAAAEAIAKMRARLERQKNAGEKADLSAAPDDPAIGADLARAYSRAGEAAASHAAAGGQVAPEGDFQQLASRASAAAASGKTDEAIAAYQAAVKVRPDWQEGWSTLGGVLYGAGRFAEARAALEKAVALNPRAGVSWSLLGLCEFELQDYENARIHLQRGHDLGLTGSAEALKLASYRLGLLLNAHGEFDRATDVLAPAVGPGPLSRDINFAMGLALLRMPLLPGEVDASTRELVQTAGETAALLSKSKYDEAFAGFEKMSKSNPTQPNLHYAYATALASLSRYDEALAQLKEEVRLAPNSAVAYVREASVFLQLRRPQEALQAAQRAVELAPGSGEAHYLAGRAWLDTGNADKAIEELEAAGKLAPNSPEVHFSLARAYTKAKMPERAERERAEFARLNGLAEKQKSANGNQAYGDPGTRGGSRRPAEAVAATPNQPQR